MATRHRTEDSYSFIRRRGRQLHSAEVATGVVLGLYLVAQPRVHRTEATHIGSPRLSDSARSAPAIILCYLFRHPTRVTTPYSAFVFIGGQQQGMKAVSICSTRRRLELFRHRPPSFGDGRIVRRQWNRPREDGAPICRRHSQFRLKGGIGNHGTCDRLKMTMPSTRRRVIGWDQVASVCLRLLPALLAALRVPASRLSFSLVTPLRVYFL
jgi:hypothetical protein